MSLSFFILFFRSPNNKYKFSLSLNTHKSMTTINNKLVCPTTMSSPRNRIIFAQDLKTLACICVQICLPTAMGPWFVPVGNEINKKRILCFDLWHICFYLGFMAESAVPMQENLPTNTSCVNWNQYYSNCTRMGLNPFQGTISFDNIGMAWVAIFLVSIEQIRKSETPHYKAKIMC